ncbi:putative Dol-P-Man:Man(7)GlcNAc(2)-PP-Dol alpha-1,6-mannosyltransferase [Psilocybe cubensis]|uniref:Mannosyltransferase n=2 Tax=Psilocybe cubensis TaxID=181762 RepID=A0A8H7Y2H1_PSICU|nr:putative Dol-P-Man:Man(7)GlcNAc(2)-PP-Dol alpha-1,6-mannosyltransferase [Psilocybe cubensis]KAH9481156.1 putative Dol-P-Man:Man(7)GlcNAc(2)-PP-Dol alpha-1,6-mannosyltransferase [Psilocybe cubensis]
MPPPRRRNCPVFNRSSLGVNHFANNIDHADNLQESKNKKTFLTQKHLIYHRIKFGNRAMSVALDVLIFAVGWAHVVLAPFFKVEESFNLHATHDVLMYGVGRENLYNYDHFTFPGAVPRTFVGSVLLAWVSTPTIRVAQWLGFVPSKFEIQIIVRLSLASLNSWSLCLIRRGVSRRYGRGTGLFFALLTCTQFHYPFWMGRTIPNMFATIPVNVSTYLLVDRASNSVYTSLKRISAAVTLLTFVGVVLRAEVALFLGPFALQLLISRQIPLLRLLKVGFISALISLLLTLFVDSYFWNKSLLWPEFSGIYFNVIEGKSSEWGTSPPLTYITSYLPKLLLGALPLSIIGFAIDHRIRSLLLPSMAFIALISNLGHKEWRFIIYVVPIFNVAAARGSKWMVSLRKSSLFGRLFFMATAGILALNLVIAVLFTKASMRNYPGGQALYTFHQLYPAKTTYPIPHVHISNLAAQTGASLFLQLNAPPYYHPSQSQQLSQPWVYNKTENLSPNTLSSSSSPFTHLISEVPPSTDSRMDRTWRIVSEIKSFDRWAINREIFSFRGKKKGELLTRFRDVLILQESPKLWLLERKR